MPVAAWITGFSTNAAVIRKNRASTIEALQNQRVDNTTSRLLEEAGRQLWEEIT